MTFSIVGFDPVTKELGVASQSKFLGVGSVVPWAQAGVGAVATQSYANTSYGPNGLALLAEGKTAAEVIELLVSPDSEKGLRQVGIVGADGSSATFTGDNCYDWAGGIAGLNYAAQGNILVSEATVKAMAETFEATDGPLAHKLLSALAAGQAAGGDKRGMQSASLLVVKEAGGYAGFNDRYIDLRVDDHKEPIQELQRLYRLHQLYFGETKQQNVVSIDSVAEELRHELTRHGYEGELAEALSAYLHTENFEAREQASGLIDLEVLSYMKTVK